MSDRDLAPLEAGKGHTGPDDGRAEWERPALRRLQASAAEHGKKTKRDGFFPDELS